MRLSKTIRRALSIFLFGVSAMTQQPANAQPAATTQSAADQPVASWNFPDFTAIQLLGAKKRALPAKVYLTGSSVRVELTPTVAFLYLTSNRKVYKLITNPDKTMNCIVMRSDQAKMLPSPLEQLQGTKIERKPAGTEVFEGHNTKIEDVVVTRVDGTTVPSKVWLADDLQGVPVKIESTLEHGKFLGVYRDISFGSVNKALFTPPDKCTPYEKMGQVVEQKEIE
jgi:hypothetical protein